ncbi:MAG TPA: hypothetical protein VGU67_02935 [Edaphobacter sp.]|nr:hypothetical protein [Edaphobacter sp.]
MAGKADYSIQEQRELSSSQTGTAQAVSQARHTVTHQGQTVVFGEYDPGKAAGRKQDPEFEAVLQSMKMRHSKTGISPATIINMLPIPLVVNSPMHTIGGVRIPACKGANMDFTAHVWYDCAIEVRYIGEGINQPWDFLPIQLAEAFESEYYAFGGVVALVGLPDEENLQKPENAEKISQALERMYQWMMGKIIEANGLWNSTNHGLSAAIVDVHRLCASRMFEIGKIPELPPWIQAIREQSAIEAKCPTCGTIPESNAVKCVVCNEILDPVAAFLNQTITEEHGSLERLTREEVTELGISAFVAETVDEKPRRLAEGRRKPKSLAQQRAEREEADAQRDADDAREKRADAKAAAAKAAEPKKDKMDKAEKS